MHNNKVFDKTSLNIFLKNINVHNFIYSNKYKINNKNVALSFLNKFDKINLTESELRSLGDIIIHYSKVNKKNIRILKENLEISLKTRNNKMNSYKKINEKIKELKSNAILSEGSMTYGSDLPEDAGKWKGKIKFLDIKSFKTVWYRGIKGPSDVVDTENADKDELKYYFNKPVFTIPDSAMSFLKKNYEDFEDGFYSYIEFLMDRIEKIKRKDDKNYYVDRTIFLATTASDTEKVDAEQNIIAINTDGNNRPKYKGTPLFLSKSDLAEYKKMVSIFGDAFNDVNFK